MRSSQAARKCKMDEEHVDYLRLREEIVTHELQHDLDKLGIAKNAREEKTRARDAKAAASEKAALGSGLPASGGHRGPVRRTMRLTTLAWLRSIAKSF
jgi:hypothetical protein